jgi:alginate O-acetyltransferase complex protein AlgI
MGGDTQSPRRSNGSSGAGETMIFLTYDFVWFALAFFVLYALSSRWPAPRLMVVIVSGIWFQFFYGGAASLIVTLALAAISYAAGRSTKKSVIVAAIAICVGTLLYSKYTLFLMQSAIQPFSASAASSLSSFAPAAIPLGISFFTFEFVHYLVDVHRGHPPLKSLRDFVAFALFWPTMIAGPIKRYQIFVPTLHEGLKSQSSTDVMQGLVRIAIGCAKKWAADNFTGWIDFTEPQLAQQTPIWRWLFLAAIAARILLDFSGYSDMAIGFARMMGITVPENFNWPYLARSPVEFWNRWHISLSTWIRDYVYIPLGGNRMGLARRLFNALAAMTLCGLWHGASWNFAVWGLYHGVGVAFATGLQRALPRVEPGPVVSLFGWAFTMLFVCFGWLLFFYPLHRAWTILTLLFQVKGP